MKAEVVRSGEGQVYSRPSTGGVVTVKLALGEATVFETTRPAGDAGGPGLHSHPTFDESFYVVEGEWEFVAGDQSIRADAGTLVHVPRGLFHSFRSLGRVPAKLVGFAVPGGIEHFFAEAAGDGDDVAAGAHHGITWASSGGN